MASPQRHRQKIVSEVMATSFRRDNNIDYESHVSGHNRQLYCTFSRPRYFVLFIVRPMQSAFQYSG